MLVLVAGGGENLAGGCSSGAEEGRALETGYALPEGSPFRVLNSTLLVCFVVVNPAVP